MLLVQQRGACIFRQGDLRHVLRADSGFKAPQHFCQETAVKIVRTIKAVRTPKQHKPQSNDGNILSVCSLGSPPIRNSRSEYSRVAACRSCLSSQTLATRCKSARHRRQTQGHQPSQLPKGRSNIRKDYSADSDLGGRLREELVQAFQENSSALELPPYAKLNAVST